jgi:hypothetical protein
MGIYYIKYQVSKLVDIVKLMVQNEFEIANDFKPTRANFGDSSQSQILHKVCNEAYIRNQLSSRLLYMYVRPQKVEVQLIPIQLARATSYS